jgi:hypothetical protein
MLGFKPQTHPFCIFVIGVQKKVIADIFSSGDTCDTILRAILTSFIKNSASFKSPSPQLDVQSANRSGRVAEG